MVVEPSWDTWIRTCALAEHSGGGLLLTSIVGTYRCACSVELLPQKLKSSVASPFGQAYVWAKS